MRAALDLVPRSKDRWCEFRRAPLSTRLTCPRHENPIATEEAQTKRARERTHLAEFGTTESDAAVQMV